MAYKANFEPNPELANLNPNRGTWERIEGKLFAATLLADQAV